MMNKQECNYYNYLTFEDLKSISTNNNNVNLIAIKAPKDTTFDIPDPEYTRELLRQTKEEIIRKMPLTIQNKYYILYILIRRYQDNYINTLVHQQS